MFSLSIRRVSLATVLAVVLPATAARAQSLEGSRPSLQRIRWPYANAIVFADSIAGVQLGVAANQQAATDTLEFWGSFEPAAVGTWGNGVAALVGEQGAPAADARYLMTTLRGLRGDQVIAARERDGRRWKRDVLLNFKPAGGAGFSVRVTPDQAIQFGNALLASASASALRELVVATPDYPLTRPGDAFVWPRITRDARAWYSQTLHDRRVTGEVWVSFVVDAFGKAQPSTVEVLLADHPGLVPPVLDALQNTAFSPATVNGNPIAVRTMRRYTFSTP